MNTMITILLITMIIPIILILLNYILYKKMWQNREKLTPFECGFDPISNARMPFSIHFYIISLIFLIFDMEIVLLFPMISSIINMNSFWIKTTIFIILILLIGIFMEWMENSIKWVN